jgi:hypothetical protein
VISIGNHAEAIGTSMCRHLFVDQLSSQLSEHQAEFVMLASSVMSTFLEDMGFFHPPTFNNFLSILTFLQGKLPLLLIYLTDTHARHKERTLLCTAKKAFHKI